jgi:hypothetical protein
LSPWWRRRQVPPKRRFLQEPHGVTTQKTPFFRILYSHRRENAKSYNLSPGFLWYYTNRIENYVSNNSSIVTFVFIAAVTFLASRFLTNVWRYIYRHSSVGVTDVRLLRRAEMRWCTWSEVKWSEAKWSEAVTVIGYGGPWPFEMLKIQHCLDSRLADGSEMVSLTRRPPLCLAECSSGTHFCWRMIHPTAIVRDLYFKNKERRSKLATEICIQIKCSCEGFESVKMRIIFMKT